MDAITQALANKPWQTIRMVNFGPHVDTTLSLAPGIIAGRSESGKSSIIRAIAYVLGWTALDRAYIRDGAESCRVELDIGSVVLAAETDAATTARAVSYDQGATWERCSDLASFKSRAPWLHHEAVLLAVLPWAWVEKHDGPGGGRALRDAIVSVLPPQDRVATVRGLFPSLRPTDPLREEDAVTLRRDAGRAADRAEGARDAVAASLAGAPSVAEVEEARALLLAAKAARVQNEHAGRVEAQHREAQTMARTLAAWEERCAEVGDEPPDTAAAARQAVEDTRRALRSETYLRDEVIAANLRREARRDRARAQVARTRRDVDDVYRPSTCPTCKRPHDIDPTSAAHRRTVLSAALALEEEELAEAMADQDAAVPSVVDQMRAHSEAQLALADAERARLEWRKRLAALGPRPPEPPASLPPVPARVDVPDTTDAEAVLRRAPSDAQRANLATVRAEAERARAEWSHLDALVAALRAAPGVEARELAQHLGDLGPVAVSFDHPKRAIEVLIDGRPIECASTGRRLVADVWFRAMLRRVTKVKGLPMIVDNRQDIAGQDVPDVGVLELVTVDMGLTRVSA